MLSCTIRELHVMGGSACITTKAHEGRGGFASMVWKSGVAKMGFLAWKRYQRRRYGAVCNVE